MRVLSMITANAQSESDTSPWQEAIEWMKRCPSPTADEPACELEIRQIFEAHDFM